MSIIYQTLYGTENDDELTVISEPQGDDYVVYSTIFGDEGDDLITYTGSGSGLSYAFYGGDGNDELNFLRWWEADVQLFGDEGDDLIYVYREQQADGGAGYDKLYSSAVLDASRLTNFEELALVGETHVEDFDLHSFEKISVATEYDASLVFSHSVDLDDYAIETNGNHLQLVGSSASDKFDVSGYSSAFHIYGGKGDDTIIAGDGSIWVDGGNGDDYVSGGAGNDTLCGGAYWDEVGYDTVLGLGGDDRIVFEKGGGLLDGGEGEDTLYFSAVDDDPLSLAEVTLENVEIMEFFTAYEIELETVDLSDVRKLKGDAELIMSEFSVFEDVAILEDSMITIQGSGNDDIASFAGSAGRLYFHAKNGDDELRSEGGTAYLWGDGGNDTLSGGDGTNYLYGGDGNDAINGGETRDYLNSGGGSDKITAGAGNDLVTLTILNDNDVKTVHTGAGNDKITTKTSSAVNGRGLIDGGEGTDVLDASGDLSGHNVKNVETLQLQGKLTADADTFGSFDTILAKPTLLDFESKYELRLSGGGTFTWHDGSKVAAAWLTGSDQKDIIDFSAARNSWIITGGNGADTIVGTAFYDNLKGDAGADKIKSGVGNDFALGGAGNDTIYGDNGDDMLEGGSGHDVIDGGEGTDEILGGDGGDILIGGAGKDYLYDSSGENIFIFKKNSGIDYIGSFKTDGASHDKIDLSGINSIKDFEDLMENHTKEHVGSVSNYVEIDLGDKNSITIDYVNIDDLRESMFIF